VCLQAPRSTLRSQSRTWSKPGAGPTGPHKRMRPSHGHRASSQRTRNVEGEPPWEGINEQRRGTEARQADSVRDAVAHRKTHLPRPIDFSQRGGMDHDDTYAPETKPDPPRAITATANRLGIRAKANVEGASITPRTTVQLAQAVECGRWSVTVVDGGWCFVFRVVCGLREALVRLACGVGAVLVHQRSEIRNCTQVTR
jgi:hypothetical protein